MPLNERSQASIIRPWQRSGWIWRGMRENLQIDCLLTIDSIVPVVRILRRVLEVTHGLAATPGITFARDREGPNHPGEVGTGGIRRLIETSMPNMQQDRPVKLSELVGRLYTLRIDADYKPSATIQARDARAAISIMNTIFDSF